MAREKGNLTKKKGEGVFDWRHGTLTKETAGKQPEEKNYEKGEKSHYLGGGGEIV